MVSSGLNIITSMIDSQGTNASPNCGVLERSRLEELQVDALARKSSLEYSSMPPMGLT